MNFEGYHWVIITMFAVILTSCQSQREKIVYDKLGLVSISVNPSWEIQKETGENGYTNLVLFGTKGEDKSVEINFYSRFLFNDEMQIESSELLVSLMNLSINQYEEDGCIIVEKGRTKPLIKNANTMALVVNCDKQLFAYWFAIEGSRLYGLIINANTTEINKDFDLNAYYNRVKFN